MVSNHLYSDSGRKEATRIASPLLNTLAYSDFPTKCVEIKTKESTSEFQWNVVVQIREYSNGTQQQLSSVYLLQPWFAPATRSGLSPNLYQIIKIKDKRCCFCFHFRLIYNSRKGDHQYLLSLINFWFCCCCCWCWTEKAPSGNYLLGYQGRRRWLVIIISSYFY